MRLLKDFSLMNRKEWLDDSHISILQKWCIRVLYLVYHSINQSMKYDSIFIVHDRSSKQVSITIWKDFFRVQLNKIQIVMVQPHLLISIIDGDNLSKCLLPLKVWRNLILNLSAYLSWRFAFHNIGSHWNRSKSAILDLFSGAISLNHIGRCEWWSCMCSRTIYEI